MGETNYQWHVAINKFTQGIEFGKEWPLWMYEAKRLSREIRRIGFLFEKERTGQLPKVHQQCSQSDAVPVADNHLTCCLGVECRACPYLLALESAQVEPDTLDGMKAFTCAAHILTESGTRLVDTSEGYVLTVDDRMYWNGVYESLSDTPKGEAR